MGLEPTYRVAAACLLLMYLVALMVFAHRLPLAHRGIGWASPSRFLFIGGWLSLIVVGSLRPELLSHLEFEMIDGVRWAFVVPAAIAAGLAVLVGRSHLETGKGGELIHTGAYRWCRYPFDGATGMYVLAVGAFSANYLILTVSIGLIFLLRIFVPVEQERRRTKLFGEAYTRFVDRSGVFLISVEAVPQREYVVPNRFGMTAIMGLVTALALIFGVLRYAGVHPTVYLFVVSEIVGICLAQIFLSSERYADSMLTGPRAGSALTSAILFPFWTYVILGSPQFEPIQHLLLVAGLICFGALIGYCVGALAAGFFLALDLVESMLTPHQTFPLGAETTSSEAD